LLPLAPNLASFVTFKELSKKWLRPGCKLLARILEESDLMPRTEATAKADLYMRLIDDLPDSDLQQP
jgi:hypothetical protein